MISTFIFMILHKLTTKYYCTIFAILTEKHNKLSLLIPHTDCGRPDDSPGAGWSNQAIVRTYLVVQRLGEVPEPPG